MMARAARAAATWCRYLLAGAGTVGLLLWSAAAAAQSINVTPSTIPVPVQGVPYSVTFVGSNGVAPYQFLVSTGMLPAGLSLSAGGALTGTPTTAAAYSFTITVSDFLGREVDLTGTGAVTSALVITPPPGLVVNTPYSGQIQVTGGTGPYTFVINSGALPPGMSLSASGMLTGTPTTLGNYILVIRVTDANGLSSVITLNISVAATATIPVNDPWMLALAALGLAWLGRRQLRQRQRY
ncbi:putative Ig domain-containing protein [Acidovorax sp. ACV01]|uniref:putative Ig domain-containing protein n=1 Tax=Acidovorax sp. ACV01 TaxID=2769311 RepID=UPI00177F8AB4|nr:putative Ig domain-containing protein [Acidovorax sp. ACV01]MBD9392722.1 putative Ig domain-containing protein [Acidovorax sp. ACV01]